MIIRLQLLLATMKCFSLDIGLLLSNVKMHAYENIPLFSALFISVIVTS